MEKKVALLGMIDHVDNLTQELLNKFSARYSGMVKYPINSPRIIFKKRGTCAGTFQYSHIAKTAILDFNRVLMQENWGDFDRTIIHEVAHYCSFLLGGSGHDRVWKNMMRFFGLEPKRCHSYDTSSVRVIRNVPRYKYACACSVHSISAIRHGRAQKGTGYKCIKCNTPIKYVDNL